MKTFPILEAAQANELLVRYLIWDLDGTLFDTYPAIAQAFIAALADHDYYPERDIVMQLARVSLSHCFATLAARYRLSPSAVQQSFSEQYAKTPFAQQPVMPGGRELCTYIVSIGGQNVIVTHRGRRSTIGLLKAHALKTLIADSITGDDGFPKKPDPSGMQAIIARNGIAAQEGLAIGDRGLDIAAGRASGLRTCLLGELADQADPDYRVDHLGELLEIIQQENRTGRVGTTQ
jgi:phosphoglycolate phosphatase-like HAD superfamily hydrolase